MIELTSKQRKKLEKLAHSMEPLVIVGGNGVTESLTNQVAHCLNDHELIKVRFNEFKDEVRPLTEDLCKATDATLVRIIGYTAILFKVSDNEDKRKIKI